MPSSVLRIGTISEVYWGPSRKLPGYLVLPVVPITYGVWSRDQTSDACNKTIRGGIETCCPESSLQQIKWLRGVYHQRHRVSTAEEAVTDCRR